MATHAMLLLSRRTLGPIYLPRMNSSSSESLMLLELCSRRNLTFMKRDRGPKTISLQTLNNNRHSGRTQTTKILIMAYTSRDKLHNRLHWQAMSSQVMITNKWLHRWTSIWTITRKRRLWSLLLEFIQVRQMLHSLWKAYSNSLLVTRRKRKS